MDREARFRFRRQVPFGGKVTPVCSPRLLAESNHPLAEPSDLGHYAVLYLDDPHAGWFDWNLCFHALGLRDFRPTGRLHFGHYDQMIQAAVNGQGIALGLDPLIRQLVREGTLIAPFRKTDVPARAWYLLQSPASGESPEVEAFVAWLLAGIKADTASPARVRRRDSDAIVVGYAVCASGPLGMECGVLRVQSTPGNVTNLPAGLCASEAAAIARCMGLEPHG